MTESRTLNYAACSDKGLVRGNNEDSAYAGPRLLALADGMGGHAAGEVASQFLINSLSPLDTPLIDDPAQRERLVTLLATAADEGNQAIAAHVDEHPNLEGMGCTLTAMLFRADEVGVCHIGDSRGYLLRDGELTQITKDDTFVQSLVDEGKLDASDVSSHPQRSLILKALTGRPVEPTLFTEKTQIGDRFMLCSDGLSDPVSYETIQEILSTGTPDKAARKLVEMALRGGGPDNVTVVVADVVGFDEEANAPVDSSITLPTAPVLAGAVGNQLEEFPRPNSSAARAAAIKGLSTTNSRPRAAAEPVPESAGAAEADQGGHSGDDGTDDKKSRKGMWVTLSIILVLLLAAGATGVVMYQRIKDTYYVAQQDDQIIIRNGTNSTVLGFALNTVYQRACLDSSGKVTLIDPNSTDKCHRFLTSDLTPAARGALEDLPEGSYNSAESQITRLASQTLPVCVTRVPSNGADRAPGDKPSDKPSSSASPSAAPSASASASPSAQPGDSSASPSSTQAAPEDLTTPGVSCREVK